MLSLLGSLLVQQFNNKSLDQSVRVTSVDYLGTVASTLRRDAVTSQLKEHDIDVILRELTEGSQSDSEDEEELGGEQEDESHKIEKGTSYLKPEEGQQKPSTKKKASTNLSRIDKIIVLRDAVLDYLLEDAADPVVYYACKFYMGMWLEDCTAEVARAQKAAAAENHLPEPPQPKPIPSRRTKRGTSTKPEDEGEGEEKEQALSEIELAELRRTYLMDRLRDPTSIWRARCRPKVAGMMLLAPAAPSTKQSQAMRVMFKGSIDYEDAYLICRYLASLRPFSQSFDVYLSQICKVRSQLSYHLF
ncbi:unnamed protein product [Rodentolepis nana]|uniref:V-ATPase_H_C domain-containing protein n=1 Tax=Rodentolepis nana TaxID=102285 RepID=A0A0R3TIS0_RODNA|nr:unnamed protein product [Rodentolepis nana]